MVHSRTQQAGATRPERSSSSAVHADAAASARAGVVAELNQAGPPLPIYDHIDALVRMIRAHQVVVVEGAPGTGKTTQLPRILRRAGLSHTCVGVTQPRRIAAVSVAWRIAAQEAVELGREVGYAIRFDDMTSPSTRIKVMTDGILLQEARLDPHLSAYDVIMVDEAHERSLNIDFVLGLLHKVIAWRGDLRVICSSATMKAEQFQTFFRDVAGEVPKVSIAAPMFPVAVHYAPVPQGGDVALEEVIARKVLQLHRSGAPGHILVFCPGEGLIKRTEELLRERDAHHALAVLPLYSRLKRQEQEEVFAEKPGKRKVILATNIAETSITIPGVNFVVDTGLAKLPWYNAGTAVATLREGLTSLASAAQRAGRAGRTGPGEVWRLYARDSDGRREPFTPEEILRVDLSEAVLRLIDLGVRDVEHFAFPTPPPAARLQAALNTLAAMGAIDVARQLTHVGRRMVPFPLSPHLARMVVEAADRFPDAVNDVLVVGAFLSARSPFLFPAGAEEAARQAQKRWQQPWGDAVTSVRVFRAYERAQDPQAFCERHYLDRDTMAFVAKAHAQLVDIAREHQVAVGEAGGQPEHVVQALAAGFAERLLRRDGEGYQTLGGVRVAVHPSSALYASRPTFAVAVEIMNAGRVYAFNVSALKPEWVAELNPAAARAWRLRQPGRGRAGAGRGAAEALRAGAAGRGVRAELPSALELFSGVHLTVRRVGRRPLVEIGPAQLVPLLSALQRGDVPRFVPAQAAGWRAQVQLPAALFLRLPLSKLLRLLPLVPLPWGDGSTAAELLGAAWRGPPWLAARVLKGKLPRQLPLGALLELDRNAHTLERFLGELLLPVPGAAGQRVGGWLSLVCNRNGGFWYEVLSDYVDALRTSQGALEELAESELLSGTRQQAVAEQLTYLSAVRRARL